MQRQPEELYELDLAAPDVGGAAILVHLDGFMDAGAAGRLLAEHLLENYEHETVARFDTDRLLDYRSRRPLMTYDKDHWESFDAPRLDLHLFEDRKGAKFGLLTGPEPDHEWELFAAAVRSIADRLGAGPAVTFLGIPMGIPHTRPLGVISHATRPGLVTGKNQMPNRLQVPGSAAALLELRFGEAGRDAFGFAVQVPHYLAQAVYPTAAIALLDAIKQACELDLPGEALKEAAERTNTLIDRQVSESSEVAELVTSLEAQYDAAAAEREGGLLAEGEPMPTADELAAQFEQFLAEQRRGDTPDR